MKSLFYFLAIAVIGAAGFFGWNAREKYNEQIETREGLIGQNKELTKNIGEKEEEKIVSTQARDHALQEEAEKKAELESAVSKEGELRKTLEQYVAELEDAEAEEAKVDEAIAGIEKLFPGTPLDEVPVRYNELVEREKKLKAEIEDLELFKGKLTEDVAKNGVDIDRVEGKIEDIFSNIGKNTFQASITAVDNQWDFVIIGAGEKSGLGPDTKLYVVRGGRLVGKLSIHQLEANRAVADITPGSVKVGSSLRRGDQVILAKVKSN